MKPEPYHIPPPRPLSEQEILILRASVVPKGGPHPVGLMGAGNFRTARSLVAMGLGTLEGSVFTANGRGVAAVMEKSDG